ncbi:MAG: hypothetical protein JF584_04910, partial [Acidobacteria bacterium]|nr:hypothetical protein [Acidobacteriota bacterium]
MSSLRILPLYDASHRPSNWNERMAEAEFAVLFSGDRPETVEGEPAPDVPFCVVASDMAGAERFAREAVVQHPTMIARVYDRRGMVGAPLFEAAGAKANRSEISAK